MTRKVRLPPLEYVLFVDQDEEGEACKKARTALHAMAEAWNAAHRSQFGWSDESGFETLGVVLEDGAHDPERDALEEHLAQFERRSGIRSARGIQGPYRSEEQYASASFVQILGDGSPHGFVTNAFASCGPRPTCAICGRTGADADRTRLRSLTIDSAFLRRAVAARRHPVPAIINTDGGQLLVSSGVQAHLAAYGARGYALVDVLDAETLQPSPDYALVRATTSWVGPCDVHTPRDPKGCPSCGHGCQYLGDLHVPREAVGPVDLLATHPQGFAGLHLSRALYASLLAAELGPLTAYGSMEACDCPATLLVPRQPTGRAEQTPPTGTLESLLTFVRASSPVAELRHCGSEGTATDTVPMMHRLASGASPLALTRLESRYPDAASLRPLAERTDGIELFAPRSEDATLLDLDTARMDPCAALRIERSSDWPRLRDEMRAWAEDLEDPLIPFDGLPFATIPASSDLLVMFEGRVYYVSPLCAGPHNQVVAESIDELYAIVVNDLAPFLMETASVVRYYGEDGEQCYPVRFAAG